jgi:hypothetical protein
VVIGDHIDGRVIFSGICKSNPTEGVRLNGAFRSRPVGLTAIALIVYIAWIIGTEIQIPRAPCGDVESFNLDPEQRFGAIPSIVQHELSRRIDVDGSRRQTKDGAAAAGNKTGSRMNRAPPKNLDMGRASRPVHSGA